MSSVSSFPLLNVTHHTSPKAPMPTGCRSEYLSWLLAHVVLVVSAFLAVLAVLSGTRETLFLSIPARDLKGGAEDLGSHEFCHGDGVLGLFGGGRWE